jgi:hypothetical protein
MTRAPRKIKQRKKRRKGGGHLPDDEVRLRSALSIRMLDAENSADRAAWMLKTIKNEK